MRPCRIAPPPTALRSIAPRLLPPRPLALPLAPRSLAPRSLAPRSLAPRSLAPRLLALRSLAVRPLAVRPLAPRLLALRSIAPPFAVRPLAPRRILAAVLLVASALGSVALAQEPPAADSAALTGAGPSRKVLVIAKVQESAYRRALEDAFARELQRRGVEPLTGSAHLEEADFVSEQALAAKAVALGVDGVLGLTVANVQQDVQSAPSVGVSVGVPVRVGPFSLFAGTSVPLGGGTQSVNTVALRVRFYNRPGDPAWEKVLTERLKSVDSDHVASAARSVAAKTVKDLAKQKLIVKK